MKLIGKEELVLAYELIQSGVRIKIIAKNFGITPAYLCAKIRRAERFGLGWLK